MAEAATIESLDRKALIELVIAQRDQIEQLSLLLAEALREIDKLKGKGHRSATPFSKGAPKQNPKPPGRKPDKGPFERRRAPSPESYTSVTEVRLTTTECPCCGDTLESQDKELVTTTDLPEMPKPEIHAYMIERARCMSCQKQLRAEHPEVINDQQGATAHRLGTRLKAVAHWLHYGVGVPQRKLPGIFRELFGVSLTQSALTQSAQVTAASSLGDVYAALRLELSQSKHVHTDDTGWSINAKAAWLMSFSNEKTVIYQVRKRHRNQEVREVITKNFSGILSTDRFRSYDAKELQPVRQQKCLSHILRNLSDHLKQKRGRARCFGQRLQEILREALRLWHAYHEGRRRGYRKAAKDIRERLREHLRHRRLRDEDNQRLLTELGWHDDRDNLLRFLEDPRIPPTNNQAERDLRSAVIARKVSHCSKTESGATTRSVMMSVIATLKRRGVNLPHFSGHTSGK